MVMQGELGQEKGTGQALGIKPTEAEVSVKLKDAQEKSKKAHATAGAQQHQIDPFPPPPPIASMPTAPIMVYITGNVRMSCNNPRVSFSYRS
jgi:hypothetical protein